jgi:hypothetical protein
MTAIETSAVLLVIGHLLLGELTTGPLTPDAAVTAPATSDAASESAALGRVNLDALSFYRPGAGRDIRPWS